MPNSLLRAVKRVSPALAAGLVLAVAVSAQPAAAVPHPPPPPGTVTTKGVYSMTTGYNGDLNQVRAWQVGWTVPQFTNGTTAWGAVGQWFSNLEGGVYYTPHEGWWVYYYGDDNGRAGNNPGCTESWNAGGGHCHGAMENLRPGQQVTFVYQYCGADHSFNPNGPEICLSVNMHDGVGDRFLAADFPRSEGPEMYAHDIETFADSSLPEPLISCAQPVRMTGQRVRLGSGEWTTMTGSQWNFRDGSPKYDFRSVNLAANPATWLTCSPVTGPSAPSTINARDLSVTADLTSLSGNVTALATALGSRRRTVGQIMDTANRDRTALCNNATYSGVPESAKAVGYCWNDADDAVDYWIPQGITTTRDAEDSGHVDNHQVVLTSWYHRPENEGTGIPNKGARVSFTDWDADWPNKYRHVLLVEPTAGGNFKAVPSRASGLAWYGNLVYVADNTNGVRIFDTRHIYGADTGAGNKIGRQPDGTYHAHDYASVLVQVGWLRNAGAAPFRYAYASIDKSSTPPSLIVGEYADDTNADGVPETSARVVRFALDPTTRLPVAETGTRAYGSEAYETHLPRVQGAVAHGNKFWFGSSGTSTSQAGAIRFWQRGATTVKSHPWLVGAKDLAYYPDTAANGDLIWSLAEHANKRVVIAVPQSSLD